MAGTEPNWDLPILWGTQDYLFIYLFLPPALNPKSYGRARVLEAPSRLMLVIGRSFYEEMEEAKTAWTKAMGLMGTEVTTETRVTAGERNS